MNRFKILKGPESEPCFAPVMPEKIPPLTTRNIVGFDGVRGGISGRPGPVGVRSFTGLDNGSDIRGVAGHTGIQGIAEIRDISGELRNDLRMFHGINIER